MPCFSQGWCVCLIRGSGVTWLGERNGSEWVCVWLWACVWAKGDENQVSVTWSDCKLRQSICYWGGGGLKKKIRSLCEKKKRFRNSWRDHTRGVAKGGGGGGRVARGFICARRKWILLAISSQIKIKCSGKLIWGVKLIFNKVFYSLGFIIINIINLIYIYRKY